MSSVPQNIMNEDTRIALLEQTNCHIADAINDIKSEIRLYKQESTIRFEKIDSRFAMLADKIDDKFKWTMGVIITLFSGLYATAMGGVIARLCGWI